MNFFYFKRNKPHRSFQLKIMKLTAVVLLLFCVQVRASLYAQKINLAFKDASLKEVFMEIKKQTGYDFLYNNEMLSQASPLTFTLKDASIEQALDKALENLPLSYAIEQQTI